MDAYRSPESVRHDLLERREPLIQRTIREDMPRVGVNDRHAYHGVHKVPATHLSNVADDCRDKHG